MSPACYGAGPLGEEEALGALVPAVYLELRKLARRQLRPDDCNRADGVGSRFFNVTTGTNLTAGQTNVVSAIAAPILLAGALRPNEPESDEPITVARGFGELPEIVTLGPAGRRIVEAK